MPVKVLCPNPNCNASLTTELGSLGPKSRCTKCGTPLSGAEEAATLAVKSDPAPVVSGEISGTFGRYKIIRKLGEGGMGAVYLGEDSQLHRQAAIKVPHLHHSADPASAERFLREARAAAAFRHPNFCPIFDVGEIDGRRYLAMAFIEGETLEQQITREGPMAPVEAAEIVRTLAIAMAEAHHRGFIHRDLKPSNILVEPGGNLIITDFGLARRVELDNSPLTRVGTPMGTPAYMSPEQVDGDPAQIGPATDIYALGVILYELVTAERPFRGAGTWILVQILTETPPPPSKHLPTLDPEIERICVKAMARSVADRYASMEDFASALEAYGSTRSRWKGQEKTGKGTPWMVAAGVAAIAAVVLPAVFYSATLPPKPDRSEGTAEIRKETPIVPESDRKADPPKVVEQPQPKPEPTPVVAKTETKPEPPKVVEKVSPKPEPPKVVEIVPPKPDPPKVVETVPPKPDPPKVVEKSEAKVDVPKVVEIIKTPAPKVTTPEPPPDLLAEPIKRLTAALEARKASEAFAAYQKVATLAPKHPMLASWVDELDDFHELPFWWLDRAEERADVAGDHLNPYLRGLIYLAIGQRLIIVKDFNGAARVLRKASRFADAATSDTTGYSRATFGDAHLPPDWSDSKGELLATISLWQSLAHDPAGGKRTAAEARKSRTKTGDDAEAALIIAAEALSQGMEAVLKAPTAVQIRVVNTMAWAEDLEEASTLAHALLEKLQNIDEQARHPFTELIRAYERKHDYASALRTIRLGRTGNTVHHALLTYQCGDLPRALKIADSFVSEVARAEAQRLIAVAQAENGDIEGALKTIEAMKSHVAIRYVRALAPIARAQCKVGQQKDARLLLERAASLALSHHKDLPAIATLLDEIGAAFVLAKSPEEAERMAREIQSLKGTTANPVHIIWELAHAGLISRAERVATLGGTPLDLKKLLEIASGQVRAGDYTGARKTLARIKRDEPSESKLVISIALSQIRTGHFTSAETTLGSLTAANRRAAAYLKCAEQLADLKVADNPN